MHFRVAGEMDLQRCLIAVALTVCIRDVLTTGKQTMTKETHDTIVDIMNGIFNIPVRERSTVQRNAVLRYWRNRHIFNLGEDGTLLCDEKPVAVRSDLKHIIDAEFKDSKGLGTRKLRLRFGVNYSGVSEKTVQRVVERSRKYQLLKARFDNKPILHSIRAKEVNVKHQCDLVDLQKWAVCYRGVRYRYVLSILDVFSPYVWLRPLSGKKAPISLNT